MNFGSMFDIASRVAYGMYDSDEMLNDSIIQRTVIPDIYFKPPKIKLRQPSDPSVITNMLLTTVKYRDVIDRLVPDEEKEKAFKQFGDLLSSFIMDVVMLPYLRIDERKEMVDRILDKLPNDNIKLPSKLLISYIIDIVYILIKHYVRVGMTDIVKYAYKKLFVNFRKSNFDSNFDPSSI